MWTNHDEAWSETNLEEGGNYEEETILSSESRPESHWLDPTLPALEHFFLTKPRPAPGGDGAIVIPPAGGRPRGSGTPEPTERRTMGKRPRPRERAELPTSLTVTFEANRPSATEARTPSRTPTRPNSTVTFRCDQGTRDRALTDLDNLWGTLVPPLQVAGERVRPLGLCALQPRSPCPRLTRARPKVPSRLTDTPL